MLDEWKIRAGCVVGGLLCGAAVNLLLPAKIVEKEVVKTVTVDKMVEKQVEVVKWRNRDVTKTITEPGKTTVITVKDTSVETGKHQETQVEKRVETVKEKTVERTDGKYSLGVVARLPVRDGIGGLRSPEISIVGGLRVLGPIWGTVVIGAFLPTQVKPFLLDVGLGVSVQF